MTVSRLINANIDRLAEVSGWEALEIKITMITTELDIVNGTGTVILDTEVLEFASFVWFPGVIITHIPDTGLIPGGHWLKQ